MKILDLSKKNPSNVFLVSDDNYTNFGPFYVKNGKVAKYTVANPNYDLEKNKVRTLKVPNDVILKFKIVESVNEVASRTAMEIGGLTGMNKDAIQKFVDTNELDIEKVFQFVKKGKLSDRMDLVSAIAGKPGNPIQNKMIKMFSESVNEGFSTEEKRIVLMAVKKISKYMNVDLPTAMNYLLGAGQELERDIQKGKIK
jgi:hypothetical protein